MQKDITDFVLFCLKNVYRSHSDCFTPDLCHRAFLRTVTDVQYHYPDKTEQSIFECIISNGNELAIFLYRLGRELFVDARSEQCCWMVHWLLKQLCACELYFSTDIGEGFYIFHGEGTVIGSRNIIG